MSEGTLRILHTGDWRLNMACQGIPYYPETMSPKLSTAVFDSVSKIVDFALSENVDAFVIGGNVLEPEFAAPSDYDFIYQQLCRLNVAAIPVVWGWSPQDKRAHWPRCIEWPANVSFLVGDTPLAVEIPMKTGVTVSFLGMEPNSDQPIQLAQFNGINKGNLTLGVAYGELSCTDEIPECKHWLLTGAGYRQINLDNGARAYYCGSPLGRATTELGPHGCALLDLNENGVIEHQFINTSRVEYHLKAVTASDVASPEELSNLIEESIHDASWDDSTLNIIQIDVANANANLEALPLLQTYHAFHSSLQRRLNEMGSHLLFAGLSLTTSASERSSNERELLGEFLFELRELQEQGWESLPLHKFLESETNSTWCSLDEDLLGLRILRGAESLGRHLLSRIEKDVA